MLDLSGPECEFFLFHKDASGEFDDRVDAFGRYLGLVFGGGECFNAAQVENGHAEVFLFDDGKFLAPELELKDFFSYAGVHTDSKSEACWVSAPHPRPVPRTSKSLLNSSSIGRFACFSSTRFASHARPGQRTARARPR